LILTQVSLENIRLGQSSFVQLSKGAFAALSSSFLNCSFEDALVYSGSTSEKAYLEVFMQDCLVKHYNLGRSLLYSTESFNNFIAVGPGSFLTFIRCEFTENFMVETSRINQPFNPLIYAEDIYSVLVQDCEVSNNYLRSGGFLYHLITFLPSSQFTLISTSFYNNFMDSNKESFLVKAQALNSTTYEFAVQDSNFEFNYGNYLSNLVIATFPDLNSTEATVSSFNCINTTFASNALGGVTAQSNVLYSEGVLNNFISNSLFSNTSNYGDNWPVEHSLVNLFNSLGLYLLSDTQLNQSLSSFASEACASQVFLFEAKNLMVQSCTFENNLECFTTIKLSNLIAADTQGLHSLSFYNEKLCIFLIHGSRFSHIFISQVSAREVERLLWVFYAVDKFRVGVNVEMENCVITDIDQAYTDPVVTFQQGNFSILNSEFSRVKTHSCLMLVNTASLHVSNSNFTELETDSEYYSPVLQFTSLVPVNLTVQHVSVRDTRGVAFGPLYLNARIYTGRVADSNFTASSSSFGSLVYLEMQNGSLTLEDCSFSDCESSSNSLLFYLGLESSVVTITRTTFLRLQGLVVLKMESQLSNSTVVTTEDCKFLDNVANVMINSGTTYLDYGSLYQNNSGTTNTCYDGSTGSIAHFNRTQLNANRNNFQGGLVTVSGPQDSIRMTGVVVRNSLAVSLGGVLFFKDDAAALVEDSEFYNNTSLIASVLLSCNYKDHEVTLNNCTFIDNEGSSLITVYEAQLTIRHCNFSHNSQNSLINSVVVVLESYFYGEALHVDNHLSSELGCFLSADSSNVTVSYSRFSGMQCNSVIDVVSSSLLLTDSEFVNGTQAVSAQCSDERVCNVTVVDSWFHDLHFSSSAISVAETVAVFHNLVLSDLTIGGFAITEASASFANCSFSNITCQGQGSAIQVQDSQSIVIESSTFRKCKALQGTVDSQRSSLTLHNCKFNDCQAESGGGLSLQASSAILDSVQFAACQAVSPLDSKGGGIYSLNSTVNASDCTFNNNSAVLQGGAIYWTDLEPLLTGGVFANNSAEYGPDYATSMRSPLMGGQSMEVASGQPVQGGLEVVLMDVYAQQVTTDNSSTAVLSPFASLDASGLTTTKASKGVFYFQGFSLIGSPNSTQLLEVVSGSATLNITVLLRNCVAGEAQVDSRCIVCEPGSYTLQPDSTLCLECSSHAVCLGGSAVFPDKEYWRENNASDALYKCFNPSACEGHDNYTSSTGKCATGYYDKLCSLCEHGYSRGTGFTCNKCPQSKATSASLMVLVVVCFILVAAFLVRSSVRTAVLMSSQRSVYFKILFNYLQVIGLIITAQLEWPNVVKQAFSAHDYSSNFPEHIFSLQCLTDNDLSFFYSKLLPIALLPYVIILLSSCFWKAVAWLKNKDFIYDQFTASVLILLLMVHPIFTKVMLSSFDCYEIGNEFWLRQDLSVKCWNYEHLGFSLGIGLSSVIVWSIALPLFIVNRIYRRKGMLDHISMRTKYGFMYIGYKHKFCYWEYVVILRKVFIVIPAVFLTSVSLLLQAIVIHVVLLIALFLHEIAQPYDSKALNDLELRSIVVGLLSIYCGMSFLAGGLTEAGKILMMGVLLVVNLYFLLYWLKAFTHFLSLKLVSAFPSLFKRCCFPFFKQQAQKVLANDSRSVVSFSQLCEVKDAEHTAKLIELPVDNLQELYLLMLGRRDDDGVD
jgi:predicted outer membrane repeat protein